ncbi:alpha/beta-hydrolase [Dichomitus squalens LYAD-421 SS1]|uniref:alpha/beta-hydrolase n=1 Tax=Dichomitus squalens (strain LYAD-421) TaxID=732165 RepID=UPI00044108AC|nr:alpha/beta-hydrolase [Dichomitus squalens LYAD-421 SS1]EJF66650.1 alpha/beta-hydrolase [Dichomitus squalens LYAD-421 SS1]
MEALPETSRIRQVYPADLFPNGHYAPLLHGRVRYWIIGPEEGTKVVLIHGISTPAVTWTTIAPYLAERGFRVLVYDLYGKGYSEAPHTTYDANLFVTQLALLLQYVRWDAAHIVGFSMGGGIAGALSASLPHLVAEKTVFISSAGLIERTPSKPVPTNRVALKQFLEVRSILSFSRENPTPSASQLRDLQGSALPGYKRSLQSCFDHGPIRGLRSSFEKLADISVGPERKKLQVLIIHGTDDEIVPYEEATKIKATIPHAELVTVEGAYHDVVFRDEHWRIVAEALDRFLK